MNDQTKLQLEFEKPKSTKVKFRCRNCANMLVHDYNQNFVYCSKRTSARTASGYLKIKRMNPACELFELKL